MKIAFLSSIYPKHCEGIYTKHPSLKNKNYIDQYMIIKKEAISAMGSWDEYLKDYSIKSHIFCRNNTYMQTAWCSENGFTPSSHDQEFEILCEQVKRFDPDILFCFSPSYYIQQNRIVHLKSLLKKRVMSIAWYGSPEGEENTFRCFDLVLTNSHELKSRLNKIGIKSEQLNHAFEPKTLAHIKKHNDKISKVVFIGSINKHSGVHRERTELLENIAKTGISLDIFSEITPHKHSEILYHNLLELRSWTAQKLKSYFKENSKIAYWSNYQNLPPKPLTYESRFMKMVKSPRYGLEMLDTLSTYSISFNGHIEHTGSYSCNLRLFESTGVGCCLLTDNKKGLSELFKEDTEIVTYQSKEEALEKARFLMDNPKVANEIAQRGQKKTLSAHTTKNQVAQFVKYLKAL